MIPLPFTEHILELRFGRIALERVVAANCIYLLALNMLMRIAIFTVPVIYILLAAEGVAFVAGAGMLAHEAIVLIHTNFPMSLKTLPTIENTIIRWIKVTRGCGHCRWNVV